MGIVEALIVGWITAGLGILCGTAIDRYTRP